MYKRQALDPDDAITQNNLGLLEEQLGRMESAKQRFAAADQLDKVLSENDIKLQSSEQPKPTETVATPEPIVTKKTPNPDPSAWIELTKAVTTSEGRREFIDFIRNGFKLNHRNDPH